MPVAFRSASDSLGTGTNITPAEPAGAAQNDLFVALCICATAATITRPAGWTTIYSGASTTPHFNWEVCRIIRGASAPDMTFVISSSVFRQVTVVALSGVNTTTPFSATTNGGSAIVTNPDPPSASPGSVDGMAVAMVAHWGAANPWVAPTGYTLRGNTGSSDIGAGTKPLTSTAAEDPGAFTGPPSAHDAYTTTLLAQPTSGTTFPKTGLAIIGP